jgi:hypothetical protein
MIVNDARTPRRGPHHWLSELLRRRRSRLFDGGVLLFVFLLGMVAHRQGMAGWLRSGVALAAPRAVAALETVRDPAGALEARRHAAKLPQLHVDMGYEHYDRIRQKRDEALKRGLLFVTDEDMVPAQIRLTTGEAVRVRMRLKGDLTDHLAGNKWSYRIVTRGTDHVFGMRRFSIQHPATRNYLSEWGWLETLRLEGILAPRYTFVDVVFNGTSQGIFAVEEHFSGELIEAHGRREGVIVNLEEAHYWERRDRLGQEPWRADMLQLGGFRNNLIDTRRGSRVAGSPVLAGQRDAAIGMLRAFQEGERTASDVFDAELFGRFLALTDLWEARHGLIWNNMNFYFNPITTKLEPIGFDGDAQSFIDISLYSLVRPLTSRILGDPEVARHYVQTLDRISRPEYLRELQDSLGEQYRGYRGALHQEFPDSRADIWTGVRRKQELIRRVLEPTRQTLALVTSGVDGVQVELRNALTLPVEVVELMAGEERVAAAEAWTGGGGRRTAAGVMLDGGSRDIDEPLKYARFTLPPHLARAAAVSEVRVVTRIVGLAALDTAAARPYVPVLRDGPLPRLPTVEEALRRHPFLEAGGPGLLRVRPGRWDVRGDLVVPAGTALEAGPGTTLRFERQAILFTRSPLRFAGEAGAPVVLEPQDSSWQGLMVMSAREPSTWDHVVVLHTSGIDRPGWFLVGAVNFFESPIHLVRTRIYGTTAEDAINVIRTTFSFRDCEIGGARSDAFDGDFVEGVVENCRFYEIGGDAVDVSGSRIVVRNTFFHDILDKAISAGEHSQVQAYGMRAERVSMAVASKDRSTVRVEGATLRDISLAGFAAFVKKPEFGVARLDATGVQFLDDSRRTLVQKGSLVVLNGQHDTGVDMDVKAGYEAGILGTHK